MSFIGNFIIGILVVMSGNYLYFNLGKILTFLNGPASPGFQQGAIIIFGIFAIICLIICIGMVVKEKFSK